jgi:hypothetical protein
MVNHLLIKVRHAQYTLKRVCVCVCVFFEEGSKTKSSSFKLKVITVLLVIFFLSFFLSLFIIYLFIYLFILSFFLLVQQPEFFKYQCYEIWDWGLILWWQRGSLYYNSELTGRMFYTDFCLKHMKIYILIFGLQKFSVMHISITKEILSSG